jgi:hypothetical protein
MTCEGSRLLHLSVAHDCCLAALAFAAFFGGLLHHRELNLVIFQVFVILLLLLSGFFAKPDLEWRLFLLLLADHA